MLYHAYSTYLQTSNQVFRDQKPIKKAQTTPKPIKLYKNGKIFTKIWAKRVYDSPSPTPKCHNVLIGSQGATTKNKNIKNTKQRLLNKIQVYTILTHKTKTQPHPTN